MGGEGGGGHTLNDRQITNHTPKKSYGMVHTVYTICRLDEASHLNRPAPLAWQVKESNKPMQRANICVKRNRRLGRAGVNLRLSIHETPLSPGRAVKLAMMNHFLHYCAPSRCPPPPSSSPRETPEKPWKTHDEPISKGWVLVFFWGGGIIYCSTAVSDTPRPGPTHGVNGFRSIPSNKQSLCCKCPVPGVFLLCLSSPTEQSIDSCLVSV